jgi:glycosyltransferase involved in cell wall biosynthesis
LILGQSKSFLPHIREMSKNSRVEYFPSWADALFQQMRIKPISSMVSVEQFNIMFAGNVGEAQDFPAVLQAVELLKNNTVIHWTIVGDGRMSDWLENEIVQRGLQCSIKLAGRHPIEKMPEFFQQADALLVSLKNEPIFAMTIPGKLQAYLMSGKPILAMLNGEGANIVPELQIIPQPDSATIFAPSPFNIAKIGFPDIKYACSFPGIVIAKIGSFFKLTSRASACWKNSGIFSIG